MSTSTITVGGRTVTLVAMPSTPGLRMWEPTLHDAVALDMSPFTRQSQAQQWPGADILKATMTLPPLTLAQAKDWECFLMELRGQANAFAAPPDPLQVLLGSGSGAPVVDNTVAGGNAAGSQMVGTLGWTPNAQGVLKRGDWFALGPRAYRALTDVNADGSGKAVVPIWPSLREQPTNNGSTTRYTNATGAIHVGSSRPLGVVDHGCSWGDFGLSSFMPSDAVITGIYPVLIVAASNPDAVIQWFSYGVGATVASPTTNNFAALSTPTSENFPGISFSATEGYGASIGTALSALAGQGIMLRYSSSLFTDGMNDTMTVTGVGYAIYYTSSAAIIDPQLAPPFTVPGGSGLAWALPASTANTGTDGQGSASSTACVYNGGLGLAAPAMLWRLASNDRTRSVDVTRLSRMSFAIQEWR